MYFITLYIYIYIYIVIIKYTPYFDILIIYSTIIYNHYIYIYEQFKAMYVNYS